VPFFGDTPEELFGQVISGERFHSYCWILGHFVGNVSLHFKYISIFYFDFSFLFFNDTNDEICRCIKQTQYSKIPLLR